MHFFFKFYFSLISNNLVSLRSTYSILLFPNQLKASRKNCLCFGFLHGSLCKPDPLFDKYYFGWTHIMGFLFFFKLFKPMFILFTLWYPHRVWKKDGMMGQALLLLSFLLSLLLVLNLICITFFLKSIHLIFICDEKKESLGIHDYMGSEWFVKDLMLLIS